MTSDLLMRGAAIGAPVSAVLMAVFGVYVGQLAVGLAHITSLGAPKDELRKGAIRGGSAGFAAGVLIGAAAGAAHVLIWGPSNGAVIGAVVGAFSLGLGGFVFCTLAVLDQKPRSAILIIYPSSGLCIGGCAGAILGMILGWVVGFAADYAFGVGR